MAEDGKKYSHIIDSATGYSVENGLASVTVISDDGQINNVPIENVRIRMLEAECPDQPGGFKDVLDHAIEDGKILRYFMPSSGNLTTDGEYMASWSVIQGTSGMISLSLRRRGRKILLIPRSNTRLRRWPKSVTEPFVTPIMRLRAICIFLEQEGGTHSGEYAMEYFYNGLCWIWQ